MCKLVFMIDEAVMFVSTTSRSPILVFWQCKLFFHTMPFYCMDREISQETGWERREGT